MAKKIKLEELTEQEKKTLDSITLKTVFISAMLALFVIICFACCLDSPRDVVEESEKSGRKAYWMSVIDGTCWNVDTSSRNNGVLDGMERARRLRISNDYGSDEFTFDFLGDEGQVYASVILTLESDDGYIDMGEQGIWTVHFSEKNNVRYVSIVDSLSHKVFYIME